MKNPALKTFLGMNNIADPLRLGLNWLQTADNIDITQTGAIKRRVGYSLTLAGELTGAYTARDYQRMYVIDGGDLKRVNDDMSAVTLRSGLTAVPMHWTEINQQVFYTNGIDAGVILPDGQVLDWAWPLPDVPDVYAIGGSLPAGLYQVACTFLLPDGRETGTNMATQIELDADEGLRIERIPQIDGIRTQVYIAPADSTVFQFAFETDQTVVTWSAGPDALGADLTTHLLDSLPAGASHPTAWRGRIYLMQYLPSQNLTVIHASQALGFHLFDANQDFISVPGRGVMLAATPSGLVIGTDAKIFAYDGEALTTLADYGAIDGWSAATDANESILFWSARGLCTALPFSNLTDQHISVAPGRSAGVAIVERGGEKQFLAVLQKGGTAFNQRSPQ